MVFPREIPRYLIWWSTKTDLRQFWRSKTADENTLGNIVRERQLNVGQDNARRPRHMPLSQTFERRGSSA